MAEQANQPQEFNFKTDRLEYCFWCHRPFKPTSHNYVHVGGNGMVYGCDKCLDLIPNGGEDD